MSPRRPAAVGRSWIGPIAAAIALCAAAWLTGEYIHAVWRASVEKAAVASLQERARTDATIHSQLLQPEFDRQRIELERRLVVYRRGGFLLLISLGAFLAWTRWLKPGSGDWVGVPPGLVKPFDALSADRAFVATPPRARKKVKKAARSGPSPDASTLAAVRPGQADSVAPAPVEIRIGVGSCGIASGALEVGAALDAAVAAMGGGATVKWVGCGGLCHHEPIVEVVGDGRRALYGGVRPGDARQLVREHVRPRGIARRVRESVKDARARVLDDAAWTPISERAVDATAWLDRQARVVLENCGQIDPLSLDDYRRRDGCLALEKCLVRLSPEDVLEQVRAAGLRGRRGSVIPVADAWERARRSGSATQVVCNGDEGDPKAAMARTVLEGDPFRVIEGLVLAAYAVGAAEGILYVRRGDRLAVERARAAVRTAEREGLLGERILGTGFGLRLEVLEGAGSSGCGDETVLIQAIDAQRGAPASGRSDAGSHALVCDIETVATLPWILRRGAEAFAILGAGRSRGTRVLSLTGKINRGGLVEVPMGTSIRDVVQDIGGGVPGNRPFKAVLAGGPFGVCIPAELADTRVGHEQLSPAGGMAGSGGLVVLDDADCIVEIVRRSLRSAQKDYCGSCSLHRVDAGGMLQILDRICKGTAALEDLEALGQLARRLLEDVSCGPGKAAPTLVLTTLAHFRREYDAHVRDRRCPAAACRSLIHYTVLDSCSGCTLCAQVCPLGAIEARPYSRHEIIDNRCTRCGLCVPACPEQAIEVV